MKFKEGDRVWWDKVRAAIEYASILNPELYSIKWIGTDGHKVNTWVGGADLRFDLELSKDADKIFGDILNEI